MMNPDRFEKALPTLIKNSGWVRSPGRHRPAGAPPQTRPSRRTPSPWLWAAPASLAAAGLAVVLTGRLPGLLLAPAPHTEEFSEPQSLTDVPEPVRFPLWLERGARGQVVYRAPAETLVANTAVRLPVEGRVGAVSFPAGTALVGSLVPVDAAHAVLKFESLILNGRTYRIQATSAPLASKMQTRQGSTAVAVVELRPAQVLPVRFDEAVQLESL
ncbi:hypothetical protein [Gloeobacter violaceus]|nr:hypothetical protein [Gloeobacter violaceus]